MSRLRFITLVGPTGAGKSALALRIAGDFGMSVVNADSRQIYTAFPVITAQPSASFVRFSAHARSVVRRGMG